MTPYKLGGITPYHYRRTALTIISHLSSIRRMSYTVMGVGLPRGRQDLAPIWKSALKSALRSAKRTHHIEYILLFEVSENGHEHAHAILMRKAPHGVNFIHLDSHLLHTVRELFFRKVAQLKFRKSKYAFVGENLNALVNMLSVNRQMVYYGKAKIVEGRLVLPTNGKGFLGYLNKKPELMQKGKAIVSAGLLDLRLNKLKRLESRGWKNATN